LKSLRLFFLSLLFIIAAAASAWFALPEKRIESLQKESLRVHIGGVSRPRHAGEEFSIESLRQEANLGRNFRLGKLLGANEAYEEFQMFYEVDDLTLSGMAAIPLSAVPEHGFPILILNHGLIRPEVYYQGSGFLRSRDFFARRGYVIIQPDYRGYSFTAPQGAEHHDFYVGFTRDVVGLIDALKSSRESRFDTGHIGMMGHSMGGAITARVMVWRPRDIRAFVLLSSASADAEDNFYELPAEEVQWLYHTYGAEGAGIYRRISPLSYFSDAASPVQIHHGTADADVPLLFSKKMYDELVRRGKSAEFFTYEGEGHSFGEAAWGRMAERALSFFNRYVKN
jgi:dipeptidyl aminopeptidase/acylaminoacyl peptidase